MPSDPTPPAINAPERREAVARLESALDNELLCGDVLVRAADIRLLLALLAAPPADGVPADFVVVPVEPTNAMLWAGAPYADGNGEIVSLIWTAMISTAPKAPTAPIGEAGVREAANAIFDVIWPLQEWDDEETVCRAASEQAARAALAALGEQGEG